MGSEMCIRDRAVTVVLVAYHHVVYPGLLKFFGSRALRAKGSFAGLASLELPSIRVIVPAYNEEAVIEQKIRNLAALDFPQEKLRSACRRDCPRGGGLIMNLRKVAASCKASPGCTSAPFVEQTTWDTDPTSLATIGRSAA